MRAGAGIVRLCAPRSLCEKMIPEVLEATMFPLDELDGQIVFREETFREDHEADEKHEHSYSFIDLCRHQPTLKDS